MDKVIIVTGAGKGIGRAAALRLAKEGAFLSLISRTEKDLKSLQKAVSSPGRLFYVSGDVSDEKTVRKLSQNTIDRFGKIDCVINNAGVLTPRNPLHEVKRDEWDLSFRVNLTGPFLLAKHVLPGMIQRQEGTLINITSGAAQGPSPFWGPYGLSKLGLNGLTRCLAAERENDKLRIMAVDPGGVRTRMRANAYPNEDPHTLPSPEEVAELFVWIIKNTSFNPNGGIVQFRRWAKDHLRK